MYAAILQGAGKGTVHIAMSSALLVHEWVVIPHLQHPAPT